MNTLDWNATITADLAVFLRRFVLLKKKRPLMMVFGALIWSKWSLKMRVPTRERSVCENALRVFLGRFVLFKKKMPLMMVFGASIWSKWSLKMRVPTRDRSNTWFSCHQIQNHTQKKTIARFKRKTDVDISDDANVLLTKSRVETYLRCAINYTNHKLGLRATHSIFLGHVANHFGYRCLDLNTNKIIISHHVTFDETVFSFPSTKSTTTPSYDFLDNSTDLISIIIHTAPITPVPALVHTPQVDVPTPPTPPTPPTLPPPPTPQSVPQIVPKHAPAPTNDSPTVSIHPMVTRSRVGTTLPNPHYVGHVSTISSLPRSYKEAFNDPNWQNAMFDEYNALIKKNLD
nr:ribonuclease H-like domain-containing protein [Tanacetum cinerariifolium]